MNIFLKCLKRLEQKSCQVDSMNNIPPIQIPNPTIPSGHHHRLRRGILQLRNLQVLLHLMMIRYSPMKKSAVKIRAVQLPTSLTFSANCNIPTFTPPNQVSPDGQSEKHQSAWDALRAKAAQQKGQAPPQKKEKNIW